MLALSLGMPTLARGQASANGADDEDRRRWLQELHVEAGTLEADLKLRELDLRDGVRVALLPYFLRADQIHLSLGKWGVRVKGDGVLTFCPCDSPPVSIGFSGGWAGPPDELIVEDPTLRIFGVPVFWLPYLWLRSPRKIGLTTPDVSFRGADGLFLGQGVHFPVGRGLELSAGGYTAGGFAAAADLATDTTTTLVRFDWRRSRDVGERAVPSGTGLLIDARGDVGDRFRSIAWDVDAIRGPRGIRTTLDLEPIARPFDHAATVARVGPVAIGTEIYDARHASLDQVSIARPWVGIAGALPLGELGGSNGSISFGPRWVRGRGADTLSDAALSFELAGPMGIASWAVSARGDGRLARSGSGDPAIPAGGERLMAVVGEGRAELSLPFARSFAVARAAGGPPVVHVVEPLLRVGAVGARASGARPALAGFVGAPALDGTDSRGAVLFGTALRTALGSAGIAPGRDPFLGKLGGEVFVGGIAFGDRRELALASELSWVARRADGGATSVLLQGAGMRSVVSQTSWGWLGVGRTRWESSRNGFGVELRGAVRGDVPVLAGWALLGADLAPRLTTATGLSAPGATLGLGTAFPVGLGIRLGGDVAAFGNTPRGLFERDARLLEARGSIRYRHPCGCFRLAVRGGRVIGREGFDVLATFELARIDENDPREF